MFEKGDIMETIRNVDDKSDSGMDFQQITVPFQGRGEYGIVRADEKVLKKNSIMSWGELII